MFQNYALFDHMNVYQNIAAPLKAHHEDKQVIKEKVQQIMEDFQIDDLKKDILVSFQEDKNNVLL